LIIFIHKKSLGNYQSFFCILGTYKVTDVYH